MGEAEAEAVAGTVAGEAEGELVAVGEEEELPVEEVGEQASTRRKRRMARKMPERN